MEKKYVYFIVKIQAKKMWGKLAFWNSQRFLISMEKFKKIIHNLGENQKIGWNCNL